MLTLLRKLFSRLLWKPAFGTLAAVGVTAILALYLYVHDADFETSRARHLAATAERQTAAALAAKETETALVAVQNELAVVHERRDRAARIIETLRSLESRWEKLFGNREQQRINARRIKELEEQRRADEVQIRKLERERRRAESAHEKNLRQLKRAEMRHSRAGQNQTPIAFYADVAWHQVRWYIAAGLCIYFFWTTFIKLLFFYGFAPRVARGRPIRLQQDLAAFPWIGESENVAGTTLWPGEIVSVRRKFLQSADDGLMRRTRLLFDWRRPLMCLASGLFNLIELRNGTAGTQRRLTFAHRRKPQAELTLVHIPDGGSLVVRPSFVAAIVHDDNRVKVRRRWQPFRWQSWVTGQFCYCEFVGPCRLVLAGRPTLQAERLIETENNPLPARRTGRRATVGFTPNLEYGLVRTARFWDYWRGENSLFDVYFVGVGCVVLQAPAAATVERGLTHVLSSGKDRARKLIGA